MQTLSNGGFRTEIEFTLPKGYVDSNGSLHRNGVMRLATAADEILPQRDPRVQQNAAYLGVIVLARVITRLGEVPNIDVRVIEGLYASDFDYLQRLYERINGAEDGGALAVGEAAPAVAGESRVSSRGFTAVGEA